MKTIFNFFDQMEDHIRGTLSRAPVIYAFIGGVAIVLFWRGVWHTADLFPFLTGPNSIIISSIVLMVTGLFVSFFIGDRIILSGLKHEKKIEEKTEAEVRDEGKLLSEAFGKLERIEKDIASIREQLNNK